MARKLFSFAVSIKKAVEEAVKTKYGEIVKSNEYLEKIFDISFTMPKHSSIIKLINQFFDDTIYILKDDRLPINERVNQFFEMLNFTNPRRVKKVLNKLQILRNLKQIWIEKDKPFPNIDLHNDTQASFAETITVLYLIITHEFYNDIFDDFLNFEKKKKLFVTEYEKDFANNSKLAQPIYCIHVSEIEISKLPFSQFTDRPLGDDNFYVTLCPTTCERIVNIDQYDSYELKDKIFIQKSHSIDNLFYNYCKSNIEYFKEVTYHSDCTFKSLKELITLML